LQKGPENITDNLAACYEKLVEKKYMDYEELELLDSWIRDLISLNEQKKTGPDQPLGTNGVKALL
jgi:hypothetical protein